MPLKGLGYFFGKFYLSGKCIHFLMSANSSVPKGKTEVPDSKFSSEGNFILTVQ